MPPTSQHSTTTTICSPSRASPLRLTPSKRGAADCDLFIAVTPFETNNILACSIAKSFGAKRTVARIDNYEYMIRENRDFFTRMGVNHLIYPEYFAAREIMMSLKRSWARNWFEIHQGQLIVVGVKIRANAKLNGMALKDIGREHRFFHVSAIKRNYETIIPRGSDILREGDIVYLTSTAENISAVRDLCGKTAATIRKCLIMGVAASPSGSYASPATPTASRSSRATATDANGSPSGVPKQR